VTATSGVMGREGGSAGASKIGGRMHKYKKKVDFRAQQFLNNTAK